MNIKEPIINPYNSKNKLITDSDIKKIFANFNLNIEINDINNYILALTHKSYIQKEYYNKHWKYIQKYKTDKILELRSESNERLEFLGDTIIKAVIAEYLYKRYPKENEGFMTKLKTKIEDKTALAKFAKLIGIDDFILISLQNETNSIGRVNEKILEDAFESFMGAIYLDSGFHKCKQFLTYILENEINYSDIIFNDNNYKDQLLRYYHSINWKHPQYILLKETGIGNKKMFTMGVLDNDNNIVLHATDNSKRKAEQKVSKYALFKYGKLNNEQLQDIDLELLNI
tara:strand:+ start:69 stop:926 length:858 start_codon:yes stop_codon:yes gene_type:complete